MAAVLQEYIDELEDWLDDAEDLTGSSTGPLPDPPRTQVARDLDVAELIIDRILDANHDPSLTPAGAGDVDSSVSPVSLQDYASAAHQLALDAQTAALIPPPATNFELIGSKLRTIKSLLPKYREHIGV